MKIKLNIRDGNTINFTVWVRKNLSFEIGICPMMKMCQFVSQLHWLKYHKPFHIILLISYFKCKKSDLVITSGSLRSCFPNFISFSCSRLTDTSFFFFILYSTQTSYWRYFYTELGSKNKISEKKEEGGTFCQCSIFLSLSFLRISRPSRPGGWEICFPKSFTRIRKNQKLTQTTFRPSP